MLYNILCAPLFHNQTIITPPRPIPIQIWPTIHTSDLTMTIRRIWIYLFNYQLLNKEWASYQNRAPYTVQKNYSRQQTIYFIYPWQNKPNKQLLTALDFFTTCIQRAWAILQNDGDLIAWKYFPYCWPFVKGIHWWPVIRGFDVFFDVSLKLYPTADIGTHHRLNSDNGNKEHLSWYPWQNC